MGKAVSTKKTGKGDEISEGKKWNARVLRPLIALCYDGLFCYFAGFMG